MSSAAIPLDPSIDPSTITAGYAPDPSVTDTGTAIDTTTYSTVGTGSSSGVSGIDLGGLVNDLGSTASSLIAQTQAQNVTRLPNGQVLLPNGSVVGSSPVFTSGSTGMLLLIGVAVIVLVLVMK